MNYERGKMSLYFYAVLVFFSEAVKHDGEVHSYGEYTRDLPTPCRPKTGRNKYENLLSNFEDEVSNYKGKFYQCVAISVILW